MANEPNSATRIGSTWWERTAFALAGFLVCLWRGHLGKLSYYFAQARLETGDYSSNLFTRYRAAFGMNAPTSNMVRTNRGSDGNKAVYNETDYGSTFMGYWRSWCDRIDWEERKGIGSYNDVYSWAAALKAAGYATAQNYASAVSSKYDKVGWFSKLFDDSSFLGRLGQSITEASGTPAARWVKFILVVGLMVGLFTLVYYYGRMLFRKVSK